MRKLKLQAIVRAYLPLAVAITLIGGLIYVVAQQVLRLDADDPQLQMAEDAAAQLGAGGTLPASATVDISTSLAPYLIIFDDQGRPLSGSARLHGNLPTVPLGVLTHALENGQNRVTWQPEPGVRSAAVVAAVRGANPGFVLAGRSLREVERRDDSLRRLVVLGWLVTLGVVLLLVAAVSPM